MRACVLACVGARVRAVVRIYHVRACVCARVFGESQMEGVREWERGGKGGGGVVPAAAAAAASRHRRRPYMHASPLSLVDPPRLPPIPPSFRHDIFRCSPALLRTCVCVRGGAPRCCSWRDNNMTHLYRHNNMNHLYDVHNFLYFKVYYINGAAPRCRPWRHQYMTYL